MCIKNRIKRKKERKVKEEPVEDGSPKSMVGVNQSTHTSVLFAHANMSGKDFNFERTKRKYLFMGFVVKHLLL